MILRHDELPDFHASLRAVIDSLESVDPARRAGDLLAALRSVPSLPLLAYATSAAPSGRVLEAAFDDLFLCGGANLPLSLGIAAHLAATVAVLHGARGDSPFIEARAELAREISERRALVADAHLSREHHSIDRNVKLTDESGCVRAYGSCRALLLADAADLLLIPGLHPTHGHVVFMVRMRRNPHIAFSPRPDDAALPLVDSRARDVFLRRLPVEDSAILASLEPGHGRRLLRLHGALRDVFGAAACLGAAQRTLEEARAFIHAMSTEARGFDRDASIGLLGGLVLDERSATLSTTEAAALVATALETEGDGFIVERAVAAAAAASHVVSTVLPTIVHGALRIVGARATDPRHPLDRISRSLMAACLFVSPDGTTKLETGRDFLRRAL